MTGFINANNTDPAQLAYALKLDIKNLRKFVVFVNSFDVHSSSWQSVLETKIKAWKR